MCSCYIYGVYSFIVYIYIFKGCIIRTDTTDTDAFGRLGCIQGYTVLTNKIATNALLVDKTVALGYTSITHTIVTDLLVFRLDNIVAVHHK